MVMKFAPYAVACLLFNNTARFGLDLLQALAWFVATVLIGFRFTCSASTRSLYTFFRASTDRIFPSRKDCDTDCVLNFVIERDGAYGTARVGREFGRAAGDYSFVLTVGATANQNGTALYEA